MFQRIFGAALIAGLLAGVVTAGLQHLTTTRLIIAAEAFEQAPAGHDHGAGGTADSKLEPAPARQQVDGADQRAHQSRCRLVTCRRFRADAVDRPDDRHHRRWPCPGAGRADGAFGQSGRLAAWAGLGHGRLPGFLAAAGAGTVAGTSRHAGRQTWRPPAVVVGDGRGQYRRAVASRIRAGSAGWSRSAS